MRGKFITFEGSEACGKSTQIELVVKWLRDKGIGCVMLREPGGTPLGEQIRHLVKHDPAGMGMSREAELLLFAASRAELVRKQIEPTLERGEWVLCDRFHDSSVVYQGFARGLDADQVRTINAFALGATVPDLTLVLDVDPVESKKRLLRRVRPVGVEDRMENESEEFYNRVREGYRAIAKQDSARVKWIDANGSQNDVFQKLQNEVKHAFHGLLD
jgi:dTMP kinase